MFTESNNQTNETFHQILERKLNGKFNSRPPKIEISGVLTPSHTTNGKTVARYKIISDSYEYFLRLNGVLSQIAKKIVWEEVTALGTFDAATNVFCVERLMLRHSPDEIRSSFSDTNTDLDFYAKTISRVGRLEPEPWYTAA